MKTWDDYKDYVKSIDPVATEDIADVEEQADIIREIVKARNEKGMSQRDLAMACDMPQSSVARIESYRTNPSLTTLMKLLRPLGLKLTVTRK